LKILGWLWLIFGFFWCVLIAVALITPSGEVDQEVVMTSWAWWTNLIASTLEVAFFVASAVLGVALLRRWRWAQAGLGILGGLTLALWVLLVTPPRFPPETFAGNLLHLGPLFVLAAYSLVVVLVPGSHVDLSSRFRILIAAGSVFGVLLAVGFHLVDVRNLPPTGADLQAQIDAQMRASTNLHFDRIRSAAETFVRDRKAQSLTVPVVVSFNELASRGYLPLSEVEPFSNTDATVSLKVTQPDPKVPWIRIRWKGGAESQSHM